MMSQVKKMTISALLISMIIILTRFLSVQNIPILPFVRISLGPALIIFASLFLGPFYGAVVGAGSDILGIVLVPNQLGFGINPLITLVYGLLGIVPWAVFKLVKYAKKPRIVEISAIIAAFLLFIFVTVFNFCNDSFTLNGKVYSFQIWQKILISVGAFLLTIGTVVALYFTKKFFAKKFPDLEGDTYHVALACIVSEILLMLVLNTVVKTVTFEIDFLFMFFCQGIVFFIDVPLNTFIVTYLRLLVSRMH